MKFDIWVFLENLLRKFKLDLKNLARITGTFHENFCMFVKNISLDSS
jgi:hypothetical protein